MINKNKVKATGEWIGPIKNYYIPDALLKGTKGFNVVEAKTKCNETEECVGITKKKSWSLRKGLELCKSKDEESFIKRSMYKTVKKPIKKKTRTLVQINNIGEFERYENKTIKGAYTKHSTFITDFEEAKILAASYGDEVSGFVKQKR